MEICAAVKTSLLGVMHCTHACIHIQLPPVIGNLRCCKDLRLSHNELESLPAEIGRMTGLRQLKLPFNCLKTLPVDIGKLEQLVELTLQHNLLERLPMEIGLLSRLDALIIDHNKVCMNAFTWADSCLSQILLSIVSIRHVLTYVIVSKLDALIIDHEVYMDVV